MAHNPITLDLLRALDAIDQRGSFAAAAEALHKVPSALTYTVQKVEQDLDIELFDRSGHRARMTPAGRLLLEEGRSILQDMDTLARSAKKIASGWEPELRIGVDTFFDTARLYSLLQTFNREHPYIKVHLIHGALSGTWELLLKDKTDLILTGSGMAPQKDGYEFKSLGPMENIFVVARNHPLAQDACTATEEDIAAYPTIVIRDTSDLLQPMSVGWTHHERMITVPTMADKIEAQRQGLGVGYLPKHRIRAYLEAGELVPVKTPRAAHNLEAVLVNKEGSGGHALEWFKQHVTGDLLGLID